MEEIVASKFVRFHNQRSIAGDCMRRNTHGTKGKDDDRKRSRVIRRGKISFQRQRSGHSGG